MKLPDSYIPAPTVRAGTQTWKVSKTFQVFVHSMILTLLPGMQCPLLAQDTMHFIDGHQEEAKVQEVGTDSIIYLVATSRTPHRKVARYRVSRITYENGQTYFISPTRIYLIDGKIIAAHVLKVNDTSIEYLDLYTDRVKSIPVKKVAAIGYEDGTRKYYVDKINLRDGGFVAGRVLEVNEASVVFENAARKYRKQTIEVTDILSIEFRNGFEQQFLSTQLPADPDTDQYEN